MNKQQVLVKWALPYREHPVSSHSFFPHPCLNFFLQQQSSIKEWHIRSLLATGRGSVPFRELLLISSLVSTFMTELTSKAKPRLLFPKDWSVLDVRIHTNVVLPVSDRNSCPLSPTAVIVEVTHSSVCAGRAGFVTRNLASWGAWL